MDNKLHNHSGDFMQSTFKSKLHNTVQSEAFGNGVNIRGRLLR